MKWLLFKFTEYGTLRQIYIVAENEKEAWQYAKAGGDFRTMQWLGEIENGPQWIQRGKRK